MKNSEIQANKERSNHGISAETLEITKIQGMILFEEPLRNLTQNFHMKVWLDILFTRKIFR